jgi:hypothetical protein
MRRVLPRTCCRQRPQASCVSTLCYRPQPRSRSEGERDQPTQLARCAYSHQRTDDFARYLLRLTQQDPRRQELRTLRGAAGVPVRTITVPHRAAGKVRRAPRSVHRGWHRLLLQPPSATKLHSLSKLAKNIPSIAHELPSQAHLLFKFGIIRCNAKTISGFRQKDRIPLCHLQTGKSFFRENNSG